MDSVFPERTNRIITQNDFGDFVSFIQTEINKETIVEKEKLSKKEEKATNKKRLKKEKEKK